MTEWIATGFALAMTDMETMGTEESKKTAKQMRSKLYLTLVSPLKWGIKRRRRKIGLVPLTVITVILLSASNMVLIKFFIPMGFLTVIGSVIQPQNHTELH